MTTKLVAITGANSGLGSAIFENLSRKEGFQAYAISGPEVDGGYDLRNPSDIEDIATDLRAWSDAVDTEGQADRILINCAGVNYIDWFDAADTSEFDRLLDINLKAPLYLVQSLIGRKPPIAEEPNWFNGAGTVLNIISNASHMPMTNSAYYNATKGALHIATLALGRELRKTHGLTVFGISPNKLSGTGMSDYIEDRVPDLRGWTKEDAEQYQLASLPAGEETDPIVLADFIAYLLSEYRNHKFLANTVLPYGA